MQALMQSINAKHSFKQLILNRLLIVSLILICVTSMHAEKPVVARSPQPVAARSATAAPAGAPSPGTFRRYSPTTETALPASYPYIAPQKMRFSGNGLQIDLFAKHFSQGEPVYIEVIRLPGREAAAEAPVVSFEGKPIRMNQFSWGWRGMFALAPTVAAPAWKKISATYGGKTEDYKLFVQKTNFPVFRTVMTIPALSNQSEITKPDNTAFIQRCHEKKQLVFARISQDTLSNRVAFPRDMYRVTSPFNAKRIYERFQVQGKKKVALPSQFHFHNGLDMYARWGDPIFAMADGVAVIAENMFYEGGFTALDHGNGIFTLYMHQTKLLIKEGQLVRAGDLIGQAGATGAANGSHLHVSLFVGGVPLDPMGLLSLPIRN
ncbi:MAG: M23 family metallopeptidase [Spirochaetia bacterium]|nr:M23 family metallopeptidase [Spirochaetia bacterium]